MYVIIFVAWWQFSVLELAVMWGICVHKHILLPYWTIKVYQPEMRLYIAFTIETWNDQKLQYV